MEENQMTRHLTASTLVFGVLWSVPATAQTAKMPPLAEVTPVNGIKLFIDPAKISAVYIDHITALERGNPGQATVIIHDGDLIPHVAGVSDSPFAVDRDPIAFLKELYIDTKFISVTSISGPLHLKATSVTEISPSQPDLTEDPRVKSVVYPGPPGREKFPWLIFETPDQVKKLVDDIRAVSDN
jgi:hypothetical protein